MAQMTLTELTALLRECAGVEEGVDLEGDVLDVLFMDLGYDSLALLQTMGHIERVHDVALPEDTVAEADTPRRLLEITNEALAAVQTA